MHTLPELPALANSPVLEVPQLWTSQGSGVRCSARQSSVVDSTCRSFCANSMSLLSACACASA